MEDTAMKKTRFYTARNGTGGVELIRETKEEGQEPELVTLGVLTNYIVLGFADGTRFTLHLTPDMEICVSCEGDASYTMVNTDKGVFEGYDYGGPDAGGCVCDQHDGGNGNVDAGYDSGGSHDAGVPPCEPCDHIDNDCSGTVDEGGLIDYGPNCPKCGHHVCTCPDPTKPQP